MRVWADGELIDERDAVIEAFSPAVMCGQGLFEQTRVYRGWPFRLADHLFRLQSSAVALNMGLPPSFELLADGVSSLIEENGIEDGVV
ncbi:MAG TPA: branched-chain amino acid aminotransferase, partial [Proteobacteria bacterium]|nr:branched-chain amino acid aminotransferase [Pseudomonadota bacterium]